jgi:hypothetical protein
MALSTFSELKTSIATWAFRTGDDVFEAATPDFIAMCESMLNYGTADQEPLRVQEMEEMVTIALTDGVGDLPDDYLQFRDVKEVGNPARPLEAAPTTWINGEFPYGETGIGCRYFYISGDTITTFPAVASITMRYFAKIPALSDAAPTNWLLAKAPNVYLFGSLLFAEPFTLNDQRAALHGTYFQQAIGGLKQSDRKARYARAKTRMAGPTP